MAPRLLCPDGALVEGLRLQDGALAPAFAPADAPQVPVTVAAPYPACLLVRRQWSLPDEAGPWAEVELALRLRRAGLLVAVHRGSLVRLTEAPRPLGDPGPGLAKVGHADGVGQPLWDRASDATWPRTLRLKMV